jgi:hypothetical protein
MESSEFMLSIICLKSIRLTTFIPPYRFVPLQSCVAVSGALSSYVSYIDTDCVVLYSKSS